MRVKGQWKYLYRTVDKAGQTVDFLLTAHRNRAAAPRFLRKAIRRQGTPEKITIDKSGANTATIESHNTDHQTASEIRQSKYLNNLIEQDHHDGGEAQTPAEQFYSLAAEIIQSDESACLHLKFATKPNFGSGSV